jgi:hypothetical protein
MQNISKDTLLYQGYPNKTENNKLTNSIKRYYKRMYNIILEKDEIGVLL